MSLDGGFIYIAGKCGLAPVLAESQSKCGECPPWFVRLGHGVGAWSSRPPQRGQGETLRRMDMRKRESQEE